MGVLRNRDSFNCWCNFTYYKVLKFSRLSIYIKEDDIKSFVLLKKTLNKLSVFEYFY